MGFCASLFAKYEVLAVTGRIAGIVGTGWDAVDLGDSIIALNKAKLWKRIMLNISSSRNKYRYVILKYRWRYHPGKKDYYPAGDLTLSYATANSREV